MDEINAEGEFEDMGDSLPEPDYKLGLAEALLHGPKYHLGLQKLISISSMGLALVLGPRRCSTSCMGLA